MIIKIGDKEFNFDGYANINEIAKAFDEAQNKAYQQGRADAIEECIAIVKRTDCTRECRSEFKCIECMSAKMEKLKEKNMINYECPYLIQRENHVPMCRFYGKPCESVDCDEKEEQNK